MQPWTNFNIKALSPSSLNTFVHSPAEWVQSYVWKMRSPVGSAAKRGNAVEAGIVKVLVEKASLEHGIAEAHSYFDKATALTPEPIEKKTKQRNMIEGMVTQGVQVLAQYGEPDFPRDAKGNIKKKNQFGEVSVVQHSSTWTDDDIGIPCTGYIDLYYPQHGMIVDIKTKDSMPKDITNAEKRQGASYLAGKGYDNHEMRFLLLTPKKNQTLMLHEPSQKIAEVKEIARTLKRFLSLSNDKEVLKSLVYHNFDDWHYNEQAIEKAKKVWTA